MFWAQLRVLMPSFFNYWILMVGLTSAAWYFWTKIYTQYVFNWKGPALLGTTAAVWMMVSTMTQISQGNAMMAYQQSMQQQQQQAASQGPQGGQQQANAQPMDPSLKMKSDFLRLVESLAQNPDQVTEENKKKLFTEYGKLFQKPSDKEEFAKNILAVYTCQRGFWEDAMASYKAKTPVKSESRKECEKMAGTFFNRERLVPPETVKSNDETIANLAAHKRVPASDGKMVEVSESMLRNVLDAQVRSADAVKKIFQQASN